MLESYISSIILSYVEKYIKNFKPEQSELSLWEGDVTFHNLDLRLEVLEEELNLPFSFVSGHIQELNIHVPWTKIASEPISISIKTIECILKLKDPMQQNEFKSKHRTKHKVTTAAPSGYIQSLVTKVVNNITVHFSNLILKYVEEDIVLSVNVRTMTIQSADPSWAPAYTENAQRKLVTLGDLTLCLDRRDASGKIENYEEPLVYRSSLKVHVLLHPKSIRIDVSCQQMEFGLSHVQLPLVIRLAMLCRALVSREIPSKTNSLVIDSSVPSNVSSPQDSETDDEESESELSASWAGWAWSFVPNLLYYDTGQELAEAGDKVIHIGFYIENVSLSIKDVAPERTFYVPKRMIFSPFLKLCLQGAYFEVVNQNRWTNVQMGVSHFTLEPAGDCFCGCKENNLLYLDAGKIHTEFSKESLFDIETTKSDQPENDNEYTKLLYEKDWDRHIAIFTESKMISKTPAFAIDHLYAYEIPEDYDLERLNTLSADMEYSDLEERILTRVWIGAVRLRVCSGLCHRLTALRDYAQMYEYLPYIAEKPLLIREELPPVTTEELEALQSYVPRQQYEITFLQPTIDLVLLDHSTITMPGNLSGLGRRRRHSSPPDRFDQQNHVPSLAFKCRRLEIRMDRPMYPRRLASAVCQIPDDQPVLFSACHQNASLDVSGFSAHLTPASQQYATIVLPSNFSGSHRALSESQLFPSQYPINLIRSQISTLGVAVTRPQLTLALLILSRQNSNCINAIASAASNSANLELLELTTESVNLERVSTRAGDTYHIELGTARAFVLGGSKQALVLSGPDANQQEPLAVATIQLPINNENSLKAAPLFMFSLRHLDACADPLLWAWLLYEPQFPSSRSSMTSNSLSWPNQQISTQQPLPVDSHRSSSDPPVTEKSMSQRRAPTPQESIHSSSDHLPPVLPPILPQTSTNHQSSFLQDSNFLQMLSNWYPVWKGLVFIGDIDPCFVYLPDGSLNAVGVGSIAEAVRSSSQNVLIITTPSMTFRCANAHQQIEYNSWIHLDKKPLYFPIQLPTTLWTPDKITFPWTLHLANLSCAGLEPGGRKRTLINPLSCNATIGVSTKQNSASSSTTSLSNLSATILPHALTLNVHVDTTPVHIALSETKLRLLKRVWDSMTQATTTKPGVYPTTQSQIQTLPTTTNPQVCGVVEEMPQLKKTVKFSLWLQWTLTRVKIHLSANDCLSGFKRRIIFEVEDIMTSLDLQNVYAKLKTKVSSINGQHVERPIHTRSTSSKSSPKASGTSHSDWRPGPWLGIILRSGGEDSVLTATWTRARCESAHTKWAREEDSRNVGLNTSSTRPGTISELVQHINAFDLVIPIDILALFLSVCSKALSENESNVPSQDHTLKIKTRIWSPPPLIYFDMGTIRIIVPCPKISCIDSENSLFDKENCIISQIDAASMKPHTENPLSRVIVRADLFERAMPIPGAPIEDRQYQLDVTALGAVTACWDDVARGFTHAVDENPALVWNEHAAGPTSEHSATFSTLLRPVDVCVVAAPAIQTPDGSIVCGYSLEASATDVFITFSLHQIRLLGRLFALSWPRPTDGIYSSNTSQSLLTRLTLSDDNLNTNTPGSPAASDSGYGSSQASRRLYPISIPGNLSTNTVSNQMSSNISSGNFVPYEMLITTGTATVLIYNIEKDKVQPLVCSHLVQPHTFIALQGSEHSALVSVFDARMALGSKQYSNSDTESSHKSIRIPDLDDYTIPIFETRPGDAHPDTGVPPALLTIKWTWRKEALNIDLGRPIRLNFDSECVQRLQDVRQEILNTVADYSCIIGATQNNPSSSTLASRPVTLHLVTSQIILDIGSCNLSVARLNATHDIQANSSSLNVVGVSVTASGRLVIKPWTVVAIINYRPAVKENINGRQLLVIAVRSDRLAIELGPNQIACLEETWNTYKDYIYNSGIKSSSTLDKDTPFTSSPLTSEQHYQDDLRAGAFQLLPTCAKGEGLPLPYQVAFSMTPRAMTWRYPQPRTLTRVESLPVPVAPGFCSIEYWCSCRRRWVTLAPLSLSETQPARLALGSSSSPDSVSSRVYCPAAKVWRVHTEMPCPRTLAACLRVDSCYKPALIPEMEASLTFGAIELSFLVEPTNKMSLPPPLDEFISSTSFPEPPVHSFGTITLSQLSLCSWRWNNGNAAYELSTNAQCQIVDYATLAQVPILSNVRIDIRLEEHPNESCIDSNVTRTIYSRLDVCRIRIGHAQMHALALAWHCWFYQDQPVLQPRYIITNRTYHTIRARQSGTARHVNLTPGSYRAHVWTSSKRHRLLRLSLHDESVTAWGTPLDIDRDGLQVCALGGDQGLVVKVSKISATQRHVAIEGQFYLSNLLQQPIEVRLISAHGLDLLDCPLLIPPESLSPSLSLITLPISIRTRLGGNTIGGWSGDIPLEVKPKGLQPWLVRLPNSNGCSSIWCRVLRDSSLCELPRVLIVFSPLYAIQSLLPVDAKIRFNSLDLQDAPEIEKIIEGRQSRIEIDCAGTSEHMRSVTVQMNTGACIVETTSPIAFSLANQKHIFRATSEQDQQFDKVLEKLRNGFWENMFNKEEPWPYERKSSPEPWVLSAIQPSTEIVIQVEPTGPFRSTLTAFIQPWALLINLLGRPAALWSNQKPLCEVPENAVIAPPRLDSTFQVYLHSTKVELCLSSPLQLAKSNSFYMPRISGLVPLQGHAAAQIELDNDHFAIILLTSRMGPRDLRVLTLRPSVLLNNRTNHNFLASLLLIKGVSNFKYNCNVDWISQKNFIYVKANPNTNEIPVLEASTIGKGEITDSAWYIMFSSGANWSCPLRIDSSTATVTRQSFSVLQTIKKNDESLAEGAHSLVLITQYERGQIIISLFEEPYPCVKIGNACSWPIAVSEASQDECCHLFWALKIAPGTLCPYNPPSIAKRFPEIPASISSPHLRFAAISDSSESFISSESIEWSAPVILHDNSDAYVSIPRVGDVRVKVRFSSQTWHVTLEGVSHAEVSARDIRARLLHAVADTDNCKSSSTFPSELLSERVASLSSLPVSSCARSLCASVLPTLSIHAWLETVEITLTDEELVPGCECTGTEVARLTLDHCTVVAAVAKTTQFLATAGDIQLDNQRFERGGFDFPVIAMSEKSNKSSGNTSFLGELSTPPADAARLPSSLPIAIALAAQSQITPLLRVDWSTPCGLRLRLAPLCLWIEDNAVLPLLGWTLRPLILSSPEPPETSILENTFLREAFSLACPIRSSRLVIEPISMLVSARASPRLYIALEQSPIRLPGFERRFVLTTPYRLGHTLAMHYLAGALLAAGWLVGSLELLGNPGGLARTVGYGLRDFVNLPCEGFSQGGWGVVVGAAHGSASLLRHLAAGTLGSLSTLASSLARNLDRLTLDEEHVERTEALRRRRPVGIAQGLTQGLAVLGLSLLGAVGGLAHHPLQAVLEQGASPRGLAAGLGLGLVGVVAKPLGGAAELVAQTGHGFLHGTGWHTSPEPRRNSYCADGSPYRQRPTSQPAQNFPPPALRFSWIQPGLHDPVLLALSAKHNNFTVFLILTRLVLYIIPEDEDVDQRRIPLSDLEEPLISSIHPGKVTLRQTVISSENSDPARQRVAEYVRSTANSGGQQTKNEASSGSDSTDSEEIIHLHLNPCERDFFISMISLARRQSLLRGFSIFPE